MNWINFVFYKTLFNQNYRIHVPHKSCTTNLLESISKYGIARDLLNWLKAFLSKQRQRVVLGEEHSDWITVMNGVHQGSVLGPTQFAVFINDLPDNLLSTCKLLQSSLRPYGLIRGTDDRAKLQSDIDTVSKWCKK